MRALEFGADGTAVVSVPQFRMKAVAHGTIGGETRIIHVDPDHDDVRVRFPLVSESEARSLEVRKLAEPMSAEEVSAANLPDSDDLGLLTNLGLIGGMPADHVLVRRVAGLAGETDRASPNDTIGATAWQDPRYVLGGTTGEEPLEADVEAPEAPVEDETGAMPFANIADDQLTPQQKGAQTRWRNAHPELPAA